MEVIRRICPRVTVMIAGKRRRRRPARGDRTPRGRHHRVSRTFVAMNGALLTVQRRARRLSAGRGHPARSQPRGAPERDHAGDRPERRRQVHLAAYGVRVPCAEPGHHCVPRRADRGDASERSEGSRHQLRHAGHQQLSQSHGRGKPAHGRVGVPPRQRAAAAPARARLCDISRARREAARAGRRVVRRAGPDALRRARDDDRAAASSCRRADSGARAQSGRAGLRHPHRHQEGERRSRSCWSSRTSSRRFRSPIISIFSISAA